MNVRPTTWVRVQQSLVQAERDAQKAVAETFEKLRERLQVISIASDMDPPDDGEPS